MRLFFLHPIDCHKEWVNYRSGLVPSHRLWGQVELERSGHDVKLCPAISGPSSGIKKQVWRLWQVYWCVRNEQTVDCVVAVHEISAVMLLLLKRVGIFRKPVIVMNFGLLHPKQSSGVRQRIWKYALAATDMILCLASSQLEPLQELFGLTSGQSRFLGMPVDHKFMIGVPNTPEERFCLAVGTNTGKDFETLLEALPLGERLVIVTDEFNAAKVRAHRCFGEGVEVYEAIPVARLRELYRRAAVVIIPLGDVAFGSGHTVFMEAQALGKIVIVSRVSGMSDYAHHCVNALTVPVGDVSALRDAIVSVLGNPGRYAEMRIRARACAEGKFSAVAYGVALEMLIYEVLARSGPSLYREKKSGAANVRGGHECVS